MANADEFAVVRFVNSPLWDNAAWVATTFRWHPASEAPPILGLIFADAPSGEELFRQWVSECGNADELEELRVSIIEGDITGQFAGYSIHISPDPESILIRATAMGVVLDSRPLVWTGRVNRMRSLHGAPAMLPRFKDEFAKHKEFLLAPVTQRADGQFWFNVNLGIVKSRIHFRTCLAR